MHLRDLKNYLTELADNNNRPWFIMNKPRYDILREEFLALVTQLIVELGKFDPAVKFCNPKNALFRINRDVRFAKDKRPYNQHLSAILSPDGTKMEQGVFFVYVGIDRCFADVAWWNPEPPLLLAMRKAIIARPAEFRKLLSTLKKNGFELETEGRLKRTPRGFEQVNEPDLVDAIRNRHFYVQHMIDPAGIHAPALVDELVDFTLRAKPLLDWGRAIQGTAPRS
jgi:uncharacterized protein (TIGR02453 family)